MARKLWLSVLGLVMIGPSARAEIHLKIHDGIDDTGLVDAVSGQKPVKEFAADLRAFARTITESKRDGIERLLGKPGRGSAKQYAMPVAQPRGFVLPGVGLEGDKDHTEFHPVGDFAGIEVWYGPDGETPQLARVYFAVDKTFPKLKKVGKDIADRPFAPKGGLAGRRKHTIDVDHWYKLAEGMTKRRVAELFSAPAGDYAPGTEYLTRSSGWRGRESATAHETLEWRGESVRIVVGFDDNGRLVSSEFYLPGRDPVTNVAERLKWDRERFDKLKKYVEERRAAK